MLEARTSAPSAPPVDLDFLNHVIEGLSRPQKTLSPKYFYDTSGSELFDQLCDLPEYYPYRNELSLLPDAASQLAEDFDEVNCVVEFGAGALKKIELLLDHWPAINAFIPIDIAGDFLGAQARGLSRRRPQLDV